MKIAGAIFDMDGVLLDSMGVWAEMGVQYLIRQGRTPHPDLAEVLATKDMTGSARYLKAEYELPWTPSEILEQIVEMMEEFYARKILPKAGVRDFLIFLKEQGIPIAVATAGDKRLALVGLKSGGLLPYIDEVVTCSDVGAGKDSPAVYEAARKNMGTRTSDTWVFEDSLHGILTAREAGFPTVGIYDKFSEYNQEKIKENCTYYWKDFRQGKEMVV